MGRNVHKKKSYRESVTLGEIEPHPTAHACDNHREKICIHINENRVRYLSKLFPFIPLFLNFLGIKGKREKLRGTHRNRTVYRGSPSRGYRRRAWAGG